MISIHWTQFDISVNEYIDQQALWCFQKLTNLEELNISETDIVYNNLYNNGLPKNITRLNIRYCHLEATEDFSEIGKRYKLKYLNAGTKRFNPNTISQNLIHLKELRLKCIEVKQEFIDSVSKLPNLKTLSIECSKQIQVNITPLKHIKNLDISLM